MTVASKIAKKQLGEIAEFRNSQPLFRGAALALQACEHFEIILAGPSETGKTFAALWFLHSFLLRYPNSQGLLTRATQKSIYLSVLKTYQAIIRNNKNVVPYGGSKPEWYDYSNGSQLHIAGLDNDDKILSTEFDIIYVNQAEGITLANWETLTTRATGRASNAPVSYVIGDCNPASASHWILSRASIELLQSYHKDNPTLYNDAGELTARGIRALGILNNLTGVRKQRLYGGLWVSAEGAIYPEFNTAIHVIPPFRIPKDWPRYRVIDFGYTNPFVCHWYAVDHDGRAFLYREIYQTGELVEDLAPVIIEFSTGENIVATIADHDAEDRATLHKHGILTIPARKMVKLGIEAVQLRIRAAGDSKPRIFFFSDALVEIDQTLADQHLPTSVIDEIDGYVWNNTKETPIKKNDHGCDTLRYLVAEIDGIGRELEPMITTYVDTSNAVSISPY